MAKVSIFIRTYKRDIAWLDFCLQSIHANLKGWDEIVVAVPEGQEDHLRHLGSERRVVTPYFREDYVGQQVAKLQAHRHVTGDYVFFVDADVIFLPGADVRALINGTNPRILTKPWPSSNIEADRSARRNVSLRRRHATEKLLGRKMPMSFMQGHCARLFRRCTLESFERNFPRFESLARNTSRKDFCEFEFIGFFAYLNEASLYQFVNIDQAKGDQCPSRQFWTIDGLTPAALAELAALGFRPRWPSTLSFLDRAKAWLSQTTRAVKKRLQSR